MSRLPQFLFTLALTLGASPALAQEYDLSAGYELADFNGIQIDTITFRGRYSFTERLGVEGQMNFGIDNSTVDFGASGVSDVELDYSYALYGVYSVPVTPSVNLFGRAGFINSDLGTGASGYNFSGDNVTVSAGAGAEWFFTQRDAIRFDYSWADYDEDASYYGVSYVRKFGG